uniref:SUEL-type lectin domain-containing protein n=1 Tax=Amphilophus citrinellus TaxID=61819 RepID=A0A3Q0RPK8_AMPCI
TVTFFFPPGLTRADPVVPSTVTAISTARVITCDGHNIQHLRCEDGVITVESVVYKCGITEKCPHHYDKLEVIKDSCDGKKMCDIDIVGLFGTHDPNICKYLDTTYACFPAIHSVTCEGSVANLQCDEGQVIVVYWADFGRRDTTTCSDHRPKHEIQNVQCLNPTTKVADSCNGKSSCAIEASCSVFGDPCVGTYKYLEVAYDCQSYLTDF